jgi:hypothetical protein
MHETLYDMYTVLYKDKQLMLLRWTKCIIVDVLHLTHLLCMLLCIRIPTIAEKV